MWASTHFGLSHFSVQQSELASPKGVRESMRYDSDYLLRLAGKAMVIYAKHLAKRCHRGKRNLSNQITFLYCCLSLLDRLTIKLLSIPNFLVAFYFDNKGENYDKLFSHHNVKDSTIITSSLIECFVHLRNYKLNFILKLSVI